VPSRAASDLKAFEPITRTPPALAPHEQLAEARAAYDNVTAGRADEPAKTGPSAVETELRRQLEKAQKARDEATAENTKLQEQLEDEKREIEKLKDQLEDQSPEDLDAQLQNKVKVLEQVRPRSFSVLKAYALLTTDGSPGQCAPERRAQEHQDQAGARTARHPIAWTALRMLTLPALAIFCFDAQDETEEMLAREAKRKQRQIKHLEERADRARDELLSVWEAAQRNSFTASAQNKCVVTASTSAGSHTVKYPR
jgi:septal ring factor EnvC (AmiA/AmiB activator)